MSARMGDSGRHPLIYVLHGAQLYGTERMAIATLRGLADQFRPILFGPPGPALDEARSRGLETQSFRRSKEFAAVLRPYLRELPSLTFVATGVVQSAVCIALNVLYRRRIKHFQIIHGGADERGSYGRKKWLNHAGVRFITVSPWARQKLIDNGVRADRIDVVPNFLSPDYIASAPRREPYDQPGLRRAIIVSRMDPLKRVGLLLDALDCAPQEFSEISFRIFGVGPEMKPLAERAAKTHANVEFPGYSRDVAAELAKADLLVHTCPVESFGLVVLEAMAANLVTLVPDAGGAGSLVQDRINGFRFRADDPKDMARQLLELKSAPADVLNRVVSAGRNTVDVTYSATTILEQYRTLFAPGIL